jgi:hypothetical protein
MVDAAARHAPDAFVTWNDPYSAIAWWIVLKSKRSVVSPPPRWCPLRAPRAGAVTRRDLPGSRHSDPTEQVDRNS